MAADLTNQALSPDELEELEEKLLEEDEEKRKVEMPVSGRSVFEIKKIQQDKSKKPHG